MMTADYTEPRSEIAKLDDEINRCCIAHDTAGAMKALTARRLLETAAATLATVALLALVPAALASGSPLAAAKAHATKDFVHAASTQAPLITPIKVACSGAPAHITCTGTAYENGGIPWKASEVLKYSHGKITVLVNTYGANV